MSKPYARAFYNSTSWKRVRENYMRSQDMICERCGSPAEVVHHRTYITPDNINDPSITLSADNLEALCRECHLNEHYAGAVREDVRFDEHGNLIQVKSMIGTDVYADGMHK